jgi:hypothetical protein
VLAAPGINRNYKNEVRTSLRLSLQSLAAFLNPELSYLHSVQKGETPLMAGCSRGLLSIVRELVESGANRNLADNVRLVCSPGPCVDLSCTAALLCRTTISLMILTHL